MHTILHEHAYIGAPARQRPKQPIQIDISQLSLDVMIYGVCGRQSRKILLKIHENMEILRKNAGHCPTNHGNDKPLEGYYRKSVTVGRAKFLILVFLVLSILRCLPPRQRSPG
jgi:hypothetical protein